MKFKDLDLIGFPVRVVVGGKGLAKGVVEVSTRREKKAPEIAPDRVVERREEDARGGGEDAGGLSAAPSLAETRLSEAVSVFTYGGETLATSYGANAVAFFGEGAIVLVDPFVSPVSAAGLDAILRARTTLPSRTSSSRTTTRTTRSARDTSPRRAPRSSRTKRPRRGWRKSIRDSSPSAGKTPRSRTCSNRRRRTSRRESSPSRFLLEAGGLRLDVFHPGHAHTPGDLCVYAPALGVLVAGDLVSTGYHPNLEDADVAGMRAALERLRLLPFRTLVPGHGPAGGREGVEDQLRYLDTAESAVRRALESGTEDEAREAVTRAFPLFRLEIVLPALVARLR